MRSGAIRRRSRTARYGARDPLLAPWPRLAAFLIWRTGFALMRPALFLGLLTVSVLAGHAGLSQAPVRWTGPQPGLDARIDAALAGAVPSGVDAQAFWRDRIQAQLNTPVRGAPDLDLARSYARALVGLAGHDALALQVLSERRAAIHLEADLRGRSAWRRAQVLETASAGRLAQGRAQDLSPAELIFAPPALRTRFARADRLYGAALDAADLWFVRPDGRVLSLAALPGLDAPEGARLYGDVRDIVIHGCAAARAGGPVIAQCRVGFLPKPPADPSLAGLTLLAASGRNDRLDAGGRLAVAARLAGRLDDAFARALALGSNPELGREAVLAAAMPLMASAGDAFTQPVRFQAQAHAAAREYARSADLDAALREEAFGALAAVRAEASARTAVRVADVLRGPGDGARLSRLAEAADGRLLALHDLLGADMLALVDDAPGQPPLADWPAAARHSLLLSAGAGILALVLVLGALIGGWRRRAGAAPGLLERADSAMTRLTLGRNI